MVDSLQVAIKMYVTSTSGHYMGLWKYGNHSMDSSAEIWGTISNINKVKKYDSFATAQWIFIL